MTEYTDGIFNVSSMKFYPILSYPTYNDRLVTRPSIKRSW